MNHRWLSRYLCYVLRHNPQDLGIELDERGWTDMTLLLERLFTVKRVRVSLGELERLALGDRRGRYGIQGDRIRANDGHTVQAVRLVFERAAEPPPLLFYGLSKDALGGILEAGALEPRGEGSDGDAARILLVEAASEADRRSGCSAEEQPYIIVVEAARAARDGIGFWRSEEGHYLCDRLPAEYFLDQRPDFRFQVSAGGVVVRSSGDRYETAVMHTRKRWELPKGKLEKGERGWEAARREVQEELGLTGFIRVRQRLDRVMYFFRNHVGQPRLKTVLLFLIHYKGPPGFQPRKREGVLAADWVSFTEAKDRLLRSGGRYLRALETAEWMLRHRSGLSDARPDAASGQARGPAAGMTPADGVAEADDSAGAGEGSPPATWQVNRTRAEARDTGELFAPRGGREPLESVRCWGAVRSAEARGAARVGGGDGSAWHARCAGCWSSAPCAGRRRTAGSAGVGAACGLTGRRAAAASVGNRFARGLTGRRAAAASVGNRFARGLTGRRAAAASAAPSRAAAFAGRPGAAGSARNRFAPGRNGRRAAAASDGGRAAGSLSERWACAAFAARSGAAGFA